MVEEGSDGKKEIENAGGETNLPVKVEPDEKSGEEIESEAAQKEEERLREEISSLQKIVVQKEAIIKDYENLLKKIQADFDNYRKRVEREREEYTKIVNERLVRKMLGIVDDLERGLNESGFNGGYEAFKTGVEKIKVNLMQILAEEGLKEIATDRNFDPYYHEALVVEENPDYEDNSILEVYQKGYTLGGKVIRPARVRVSRKIENENKKEETGEA